MGKTSSKSEKTRAQADGADAAEAGDILLGGDAITQYLRGLLNDPSLTRSTVYRWLSENYLPHSSIGALKTASKSALRQYLGPEGLGK